MVAGQTIRADRAEEDTLRQISKLLEGRELYLFSGVDGTPLEMPASVRELLSLVADELAEGNAIAVAPLQAEVTPRQGAELLGISRPYLMRLIKAGEIRSHKVGSHHRIPLTELLTYRRDRDERRRRGLDELASESQRLGLK
jgi:excisionase family DNA binding protein